MRFLQRDDQATHLSDAELVAALDGEPGSSVSAHLSSCTRCAAELDTMRTSLRTFRVASIRMAAAQPLVFHRPVVSGRAPAGRGRMMWGLSLATSIVIAGALIPTRQPVTGSPAQPIVAAQGGGQAQPSEEDRALLQSIDSDLEASYPPSLDPLANPNNSD